MVKLWILVYQILKKFKILEQVIRLESIEAEMGK